MRISWCVKQIIFQFINCSCCHMHSGIAGCIIDINISVLLCDSAVCKYYIGNISDSLFSKWYKKYTGWLSDHFGRIIQISSEYIEDITKSCCCISYTVSNIDPAFLTSDRHCTCTVLGLCQSMINSLADNLLLIDHCMFNIITETKSDSSAASCFNETIHRTCIECIFAVYKFRMKNYISLLRRMKCFQIIKALPCLEVFCSYDACFCNCCRKIRICFILALRTEHTINPTIFMFGQTHVIYICFFRAGIRKLYRIIPEMESIDSCIALCYCKERFTVISLYADNQIIFSVQLNSTGVHYCIDSETFLEIGVCLRVQVISPFNRCKLSCQYRIFITVINSIIKICFLIFSCDQFFYFRFFNVILFIQHFSSSLLLPYTYVRCDTGISMVLQ